MVMRHCDHTVSHSHPLSGDRYVRRRGQQRELGHLREALLAEPNQRERVSDSRNVLLEPRVHQLSSRAKVMERWPRNCRPFD